MLWLLLLIPALVVAYILAQRRRQRYALRYASLSLVKEALGRGPGIRRHIPPALFLMGLAVMLVALARPVSVVTLPAQEGTVILTMDVSGSMRADDLKPSRLDASKSAARAFVENEPPGVRIGVVSFSDNAFVVQAPTDDKEAVLAAINRLTPQRGTAVGRGLLTSLDAISKRSASGEPKLIARPRRSNGWTGCSARSPRASRTPSTPSSGASRRRCARGRQSGSAFGRRSRRSGTCGRRAARGAPQAPSSMTMPGMPAPPASPCATFARYSGGMERSTSPLVPSST